ncbi:Branched-chain amino acid aminotransferase/4-amino-4-deoxychorismate lyase [Frankia sp. AiPs1]|uniref:aminotransferase class IV n=1 Tax=Frankia sp. AiPa1 TaxID=573492 RepID=UPI00202B4DB9|nr:aminotransferase class IV [Frankia sp. AiPa1]MCL9758891.1 aminotransferase class IV [Frankia sp. AiPa1]
MVAAVQPYVEVDGQAAAPASWGQLALHSHGHFTVMQVRAGGTRGLRLHLDRLDSAHRELYGEPLDGELVRARIRQALPAFSSIAAAGGVPGSAASRSDALAVDATVRVIATDPAGIGPGRLVVAVGPPVEAPTAPLRLMSVPYLRPFPHIKHLGTFGQLEYARLAHRRGFDEALLTGPDGTIAEGARTNLGLLAGETVTWPDAPCLTGVTMALLQQTTGNVCAPVRLADLTRYDAAVVTNSRGLSPVATIDDHSFSGSDFADELVRRYHAIPYDRI